MQIVTQELIDLGVDKEKKLNESQLLLLDIKNDENEEWRRDVLGKELSDARAELFVLLHSINDSDTQDKIIQNYKSLQKFRKEQDEIPKPPLESKEKVAKTTNNSVTIYCDGGCTPNPGEAGSGVAVYRDEILSELWYGLYEEMGTNNTAELNALYQSLLLAKKELDNGNQVEIKCDSMYSINCIKTWAISWEKKGWTKKGGEIKNLEIIKLSYSLYNSIKSSVKLTHIKAHAGYEGNELADRMTIYTIKEKNSDFTRYSKEIDIDELLKMRTS
jgi:ribonuclease HI